MKSFGPFLLIAVGFAICFVLTHERVQSWEWVTIAQVVGATATTAAVFVALFKEEWLHFWNRPRLDFKFKLAPPDCHKMLVRVGMQLPPRGETAAPHVMEYMSPAYYFRLWIFNSGTSVANHSQVFVTSVDRIGADGVRSPVDRFSPMNLRWSHSHEVFKERISPDMGAHCDLCHFFHPQAQSDVGASLKGVEAVNPKALVLVLDTEVAPNNGGSLLAPGSYLVTLQLAASNAAPVVRYLRIEFDGTWLDDEKDMLSKGISIREVRHLP